MTIYSQMNNNIDEWYKAKITQTEPSDAAKTILEYPISTAANYLPVMQAELDRLKELQSAFEAKKAQIKEQYLQPYWDGAIADASKVYAPQFEAILSPMKNKVNQIAIDLKYMVEGLQITPITAEINTQLDTLEKVDLDQEELNLFVEQYSNIPLALKRLESIAKKQELEFNGGSLRSKKELAYRIARPIFETYEMAYGVYAEGLGVSALNISVNLMNDGVQQYAEQLKEVLTK